MKKTLRLYEPGDLDALLKLFKETVHTVNARDYTTAQLDAWAPEVADAERWQQTLTKNYTLIAEQGGAIIGFADIESNGYFNRLYVHKDFQAQGVAKLLANALEDHIIQQGSTNIMVTASITAKPFFESRGYFVVDEVNSESDGQVLTNYLMVKTVEAECFVV
jgi:putative acetyltransferase